MLTCSKGRPKVVFTNFSSIWRARSQSRPAVEGHEAGEASSAWSQLEQEETALATGGGTAICSKDIAKLVCHRMLLIFELISLWGGVWQRKWRHHGGSQWIMNWGCVQPCEIRGCLSKPPHFPPRPTFDVQKRVPAERNPPLAPGSKDDRRGVKFQSKKLVSSRELSREMPCRHHFNGDDFALCSKSDASVAELMLTFERGCG
jgi:hypothetical protein